MDLNGFTGGRPKHAARGSLYGDWRFKIAVTKSESRLPSTNAASQSALEILPPNPTLPSCPPPMPSTRVPDSSLSTAAQGKSLPLPTEVRLRICPYFFNRGTIFIRLLRNVGRSLNSSELCLTTSVLRLSHLCHEEARTIFSTNICRTVNVAERRRDGFEGADTLQQFSRLRHLKMPQHILDSAWSTSWLAVATPNLEPLTVSPCIIDSTNMNCPFGWNDGTSEEVIRGVMKVSETLILEPKGWKD